MSFFIFNIVFTLKKNKTPHLLQSLPVKLTFSYFFGDGEKITRAATLRDSDLPGRGNPRWIWYTDLFR